jgi:PKD repeat protein
MPYPKGITYGITFVLSILCINARALLADFTVSSSIGCAPFYLSCTNLSSGASSYDWDWGDGSSHASITTPSHTYSSPGTYTITLTAYSSSGASSVKTKSVIVSDTPFVFFKASDTVACTCNSVSFTDSSVLHAAGSGTYLWQFGDGGTSASKNPAYAYCSSRSTGYSVILKVTNSSGCISSLSKPYYIHVYDPPSASFSASPTIICGTTGTVNFTSSVSGGPSPYTYDWDFGDGTSHATSANPAHTYSSSSYGSFTVTLVVTSRAGCKDTIKMTNYINLEHFVASFTTNPSPPSICANEYLIVTNTSTPGFDATTWVWGDGDSSNVSATYHLYDTARTYTVKLISSHGDCKDSTTKSVTVRPLPVINFGASPLQPCPAPVTINFTDSSSGVSTYSWNFGDGGTSTAKNPSHTYYKNKSFDVTLKGTNSYGCTDSLTRSGYIKIYDLLSKINDGVDSVGGCAPFNQPFYFSLYYIDTAAGLAVNYPYSAATAKWNFGDGDTSGSFNPTHSYKFMGNYKVTLTVTTSNGCTVKDSVGVRSGSHSHPSFTGSPNVGCVHQTIFFDNTTPDGRSYYWFFGDGGVTYTYDTGIVQHKYSDTGHFEVALVSVNNGCQDTFIRKNYLNIILPRANYDWIYVCDSINKMIFRSSSEGVTSFIWRFGDGTIDSTTDSPAHTYPISPHLYPDTLVVYNSTT